MSERNCCTCKHEDIAGCTWPCISCRSIKGEGHDKWQPKASPATIPSKIYIAGPMRGYPRFNFEAFHDAHAQLLDTGDWVVISPAQMDCVLEGWSEYPPEGYECTPEDGIRFIRRDIDVLLSFQPERGDAIYMLKGWQDSKGARVEHALAIYLGLTVLYAKGAMSQ